GRPGTDPRPDPRCRGRRHPARPVTAGIRRLRKEPAYGRLHLGARASSGARKRATPAWRNEKAAGGALTAKPAPHRRGRAPALGLRPGVTHWGTSLVDPVDSTRGALACP